MSEDPLRREDRHELVPSLAPKDKRRTAIVRELGQATMEDFIKEEVVV